MMGGFRPAGGYVFHERESRWTCVADGGLGILHDTIV